MDFSYLFSLSPHHFLRSLGKNIRIIVSELLFYQLLICAVASGINLFELESNGLFSLRSMIPIYDFLIILTMTFVSCYLSENLTSNLSEISEIFYNFAWYKLSVQTQKLLMPPIQHSQQKFRLSGLGIVDCSLFVFGKVS